MSIAASATIFDTVTAYLSWDHDRLDALLESVRSYAENGDWEHARGTYAEFQRGLDRHIHLEEEILFPLFDARSGMTGPTSVMREEHKLIRGVLVIIGTAVAQGDILGVRDALAALAAVLPPHNEKEEQVLYPTTDRVLPEGERTRLAARLQSE